MIIFKSLSWKNFLSTGNYKTTVDLTRHYNTLISGENGAGKSTMLDALTFALFGKSFRGINIPQLPNSINEKNCEVEITFTIGNEEYRVFRSLKPKKFEIYKNGELLDQDAKAKDYQKILEEQILKMTYKSFCQVVILGSSNYVPFMQLSASDRRAVVENLLDIDVFSVMNTLVKARLQMTKEYIKNIDHKIDLVKNRIEDKEKLISTLEKKSNDSVENYQKEITENQNHLDDLKNQIENQKNSVTNLESQINDKEFISTSLLKMDDIDKQMKRKSKNIKKEITFYENNKICPSCNQSIVEEHKNDVLQSLRDKDKIYEQRLLDIEKEIDLKEKRLGDINSIIENVNNIEKQISIKQNEVSASLQYIDKIQKNIKSILNEGSEIQEAKNELNQLIGEGKNHFEKRKELIEDKHYYNIASTLLKDSGIKSKIIKHYLPIMNKLINKYLSDMDFFCQFNLDENFNETIKSRHRDEFSYHSFSEGERLRIDLSLLLAWREIARLKNSVNCNLLILDEVFDSSLDAVGTEEFLKLLTSFGSRANIFVISHKSDTMTDKFQNHIVFEKKNNFSRIK